MPAVENGLSPYQLALIRFWRGEYDLLLDVDTLSADLAAWKRPDAPVPAAFCRLVTKSRYAYFDDLIASIRNAELAAVERDFLELLLMRVLSEGDGAAMDSYRFKELSEMYLRNHSDSPFRPFVEENILGELPDFSWTFGGSIVTTGAVLIGNVSDYFSPNMAIGLELEASYKNIVLIPCAGLAVLGSVQTPFLFKGESVGSDSDNNSYGADSLDLLLGYRIELGKNLSVLPRIGAGLYTLYFGTENRLGYIPTANVGVVLEYLCSAGGLAPSRTKGKSAIGIEYKMLARQWEDRFTGSQVSLSVRWPGWLSAY
jgi:hypothetical protein